MSYFYKIWGLLCDKHRYSLMVLFLFMLVGMALETLGVGLVVPALVIMLNPDLSSTYPELQAIFNAIGNPSHNHLVIIGMSMLVTIYCVKAFFLIFLLWKQSTFASNVQINLSQRLFTAYLTQPYSFHLQRNSAQLLYNISTPVGYAIRILTLGLTLLSEILVLIGISILIFMMEPLGAIIILMIFGSVAWLFNTISRNRLLKWGKEFKLHERFRIHKIQEGLGAVKDVKLSGREEYFLKQYHFHNKNSVRATKNQGVVQSLPRTLFELLAILCLMIIVIVLLSRGETVESIIPVIGMFAVAAFRIMPSVNRILNSVQGLRFSFPIAQTLFDEFNEMESNDELKTSSDLEFINTIKIENVSYKYPSSDVIVLKNINCCIPIGSSVGFIGVSGAGKSTLVDIILGLLKPENGKITLDGKNVNNNLRTWQNKIGYVPQSIYLTDDTLLHNIGFGLPDEEINMDKIWKAVGAAQLRKFVDSLADGINTFVGERGVRLSGGQRQRIGIARALYHDPDILVLDEATSSLDTATEKDVMNSVRNLKGDKTLIIVAHRLSTIEECDYLYRLDNGRLIDKGNTTAVLKGMA